jgi:hypothetical protein
MYDFINKGVLTTVVTFSTMKVRHADSSAGDCWAVTSIEGRNHDASGRNRVLRIRVNVGFSTLARRWRRCM